MHHGFGGTGYGMGLIWIIGLLAFIAIILLIIRVTNLSNNNQNSSVKKSALEILKERFAKGEIDKEEFTEQKKELM